MTTGWPHRALLTWVLSVSPINSCDFPIFFRTNLQHFRRIYENKLKDPVLKCLWISMDIYEMLGTLWTFGQLLFWTRRPGGVPGGPSCAPLGWGWRWVLWWCCSWRCCSAFSCKYYIYINNLITTITIIYNIVIYVMIHFSQVHLGLDALEGDDWICFFCTRASVLAFVSSEVTKVSRRHWLSPHEGAQINMNYIQRWE